MIAASDPSLSPRRLAPIDLDELVSRAALQTRVDRKYVVTTAAAAALIERLAHGARVLEIDGRRDFEYASLYYDTPALDSYHLAARGRRRRWKVRRRDYLDTGTSWLEVKTRHAGQTVKHRVPCSQLGSLTEDDTAYVDDILRSELVDDIDTQTLAPALQTRYRRTTLYLPDNDSRVTLDTHLAFTAADQSRALAVPSRVVIETKTPGAPCVADRELWSMGLRPVRISKYGTGLAALRPDLPHTKWRRVMQRALNLNDTRSAA